MKEEILRDIGFSKNESKVYLTLLRLGSSSATNIIQESGLHRSNVYDVLESLTKKGLVAHILKEDVKYFEVTPPHNLSNILKERELRLSNILPQLLIKTRSIKQDVKIQIFEGYSDLKKMITHFVNNKVDYYSYGIPRQFPKVLKSWLPIHHRDRIKKRVHLKIIFNEGAEDRARIVNEMEFAEARYFPKEFAAPVSTEISGDEIMIIHWAEKPLIIHIKSKEISDSYKRYFNLLWNIAKQPTHFSIAKYKSQNYTELY